MEFFTLVQSFPCIIYICLFILCRRRMALLLTPRSYRNIASMVSVSIKT